MNIYEIWLKWFLSPAVLQNIVINLLFFEMMVKPDYSPYPIVKILQ